MLLDFLALRRFPLDLALTSATLVAVSTLAYSVLYAVWGFTYELFFFSIIVFAVVGLLTLFLKGLRGSVVVRLLYAVAVLALFEEILLRSALAWYGFLLASVGLVFLPLVGAVLAGRGTDVRVVFEVCGLLFATRIVLSPLPTNLQGSAAFLPVVYTLIMCAIVMYLWFRRIPLDKIGLCQGVVSLPYQLVAGVAVGGVLGLVEHFILRPPAVEIGANVVINFLYLLVVMMVFVGLTEELLFRGLLQSYFGGLMSRWQAIHLSSLIFALFHIGWLNPMEVVFAYCAGVVFGYFFIKTGGLTAPVVAHGFGNVVLYMLALGL